MLSKLKHKLFVKSLTLYSSFLIFPLFKEIFNTTLNLNKGQFIGDMFMNFCILNTIRILYPNQSIMSEEGSYRGKSRWIVDPIDGSLSFKNGYKGFVTQVCQMNEKGEFLQSIIIAPKLKYTFIYHHIYGFKYLHNNKDIELHPLSDSLRILVDNYPEPRGIAKILCEKFRLSYLESGSLSLKVMLVAIGKADLFVKNVPVRDWDIFPTVPFCEDLGLQLTDFNGEDFVSNPSFEKYGLIVSSKKTYNKSLNMVRSI